MAYLIVSTDTRTGTVQYARNVGKAKIVWTANRAEARRYTNAATADEAARRIVRDGLAPLALATAEESAP